MALAAPARPDGEPVGLALFDSDDRALSRSAALSAATPSSKLDASLYASVSPLSSKSTLEELLLWALSVELGRECPSTDEA